MNASLDVTGAGEQEALDWLFASQAESTDDEASALNVLGGAGAGALTGAATGAALGPFGALAGGLIGGAAGAITTATAPRPSPPPRPAPAARPPAPAARPPQQTAAPGLRPVPIRSPRPARSTAAATPPPAAAPNLDRLTRQLERLVPLLAVMIQQAGTASTAAEPPDLMDLVGGGAPQGETADEPEAYQESLSEYFREDSDESTNEDFGDPESSAEFNEGLPEDDSEAITPACAVQDQMAGLP